MSSPSGLRWPPMALTFLASLPALGDVTKIRSPQMMGVEPLHDGSLTFHTTFSVSDQEVGRPLASLTPLSDGPRHWGQS
jgi:hypothetical protein